MSTPTQTPAELAAFEIDHHHTDAVICPYCGHRHSDSREYFMERRSPLEIECEACEKPFTGDVEFTVTYSTEKLIQAELDSVCEGLNLDLLLKVTDPEVTPTEAEKAQLHALVSRAKRAKEGKGA